MSDPILITALIADVTIFLIPVLLVGVLGK